MNISLTRTVAANKKKFLKSKIINWLLKEADAVVCLSSIQKKYLEDSFEFLRGKVFFVPLGVDASYHQPVYSGRQNYILSVGRDDGRDYKTVVEVARLLPNNEFQIICSKRNLLGIENMPNNVKVFYDTEFSELALKYKEARLLLLITHDNKYLDGSDCSGQTVLLDAMANGLPVIASRKAYLPDYVTDGKEVLYVDFYSVSDIIKSIDSLRNQQARGELSGNARHRVDMEFSTEKMAERLAEVFKKS